MSSPVSPSNLPGSTAKESQVVGEDDDINLLDAAIVLAKFKWLILGLPLFAGIVTAGMSLLQPNIYTATTRIIPPQQGGSSGSGLLSVGGLGGSLGIRSPNDLYIGMLKSRTVADNMIQRFGMSQKYPAKYPSQVRARLANATNFVVGKDGIIAIEVDDQDPQFAAELANAYVDELLKLTTVLAVSDASQRRLFFEQQFEQAKNNLVKAEMAARQAMEQGGLVEVAGQGRAMMEATARLRAQITVKEVQMGVMRTFAADRNPELQLAQKELEALRHELAKIEGATGSKLESQRGSNSRGLESLRFLRDVKYYETIYELLAKQFEMAKIEEAKESTVVQVLDRAIKPDEKSKPQRRTLVLTTVFVVGILSIFLAFVIEAGQKVRRDTEQAEKLKILRRYIFRK